MEQILIISLVILAVLVIVLISLLFRRVQASTHQAIKDELAAANQRAVYHKESQINAEKLIIELRQETKHLEEEIRDTLQRNSAIESKIELLETHLDRERQLNEKQESDLKKQYEDLSSFREQIAQLQSINQALSDKLAEQEKNLIKQSENLIAVFKNEAQRAFEEKSQKFSDENRANIETILKPLNEKIKSFQHRVEETHKDTIDRHASLREQILNLKDLNETMSKEAKQLTKALKGDNKIQGNWGEVVLQRVLEKSGLEKGREYEIQQSFQTEDGRKQPDVIIYLPDQKKLIIDSKVSLTAYERMVNSHDEDLPSLLKTHLHSIKTHIDQLSAKRYHDLYQMESPDFVLMFIPIETAFSSAINADPGIYNKAFDKNIVIVTPSTLLATLKSVDSIWQNEKQKRHTIEIAREAGKMYDKFVALLNDLNKIGERMDQTKAEYGKAINKLHEGRGDLITRAEKLKRLGAKASKTIGQKWIDHSAETNEE